MLFKKLKSLYCSDKERGLILNSSSTVGGPNLLFRFYILTNIIIRLCNPIIWNNPRKASLIMQDVTKWLYDKEICLRPPLKMTLIHFTFQTAWLFQIVAISLKFHIVHKLRNLIIPLLQSFIVSVCTGTGCPDGVSI